MSRVSVAPRAFSLARITENSARCVLEEASPARDNTRLGRQEGPGHRVGVVGVFDLLEDRPRHRSHQRRIEEIVLARPKVGAKELAALVVDDRPSAFRHKDLPHEFMQRNGLAAALGADRLNAALWSIFRQRDAGECVLAAASAPNQSGELERRHSVEGAADTFVLLAHPPQAPKPRPRREKPRERAQERQDLDRAERRHRAIEWLAQNAANLPGREPLGEPTIRKDGFDDTALAVRACEPPARRRVLADDVRNCVEPDQVDRLLRCEVDPQHERQDEARQCANQQAHLECLDRQREARREKSAADADVGKWRAHAGTSMVCRSMVSSSCRARTSAGSKPASDSQTLPSLSRQYPSGRRS